VSAATSGAARDQVARLLRLVPYLNAREAVPLEDAARALGVPPDQLDKDLRVLFMCGLPGGYPDDLIDVDLDALEGEGVIRVSNADYLARPLRLTPTEASAIIVALRALRSGADDDTREVVDRALAKLEGAAAGSTPLVDPGADDPGPLALRAQLEDAVRRRRQLRITYYVPSRDEESERVVDPHAVVSHHGVAYLDAYCHSADAPRLFRLDRIHEAVVLDSEITTQPAGPRDLSDGVLGRDEATRVTLRLGPPRALGGGVLRRPGGPAAAGRWVGGRPAGRRRAVAHAAAAASGAVRRGPRTRSFRRGGRGRHPSGFGPL
jgi:proteasome accessory factor C